MKNLDCKFSNLPGCFEQIKIIEIQLDDSVDKLYQTESNRYHNSLMESFFTNHLQLQSKSLHISRLGAKSPQK